MPMNRIIVPGERSGSIRILSSKSFVHRMLICAALGNDTVTIHLNGLSKDILATAACLDALGAKTTVSERQITVVPIRKTADAEEVILPVGESGSTLRFLLPLVGALGFKCRFVLEGRLPQRPLQPLQKILEEHGMRVRKDGNQLFADGRLTPGAFLLSGNVSSQYFTGLLMALPLLTGNSTLTAEGVLESAGYIRITEEILEKAGICVIRNKPGRWLIHGSQRPQLPSVIHAEGDWSNAAFFLCMGALSRKGVSVSGLNLSSKQGDSAVLDFLIKFGAKTAKAGNEVSAAKGKLLPFTIDAGPVPDLIPVISIMACAAQGDTEIKNALRLRSKESDRLQTTAEMINALGGEVTELPDGLVVHGSGKLKGGTVNSYNDHRIAMSAAVAASICQEPVQVLNAECVAKSYLDFWKEFDTLEVLL